jgi:DNA-binding GntR family transcriptional regulator
MSDITVTEFLVDDYISRNGLADGARLPAPRELAARLSRDEATVLDALKAAERRLRIVHNQDGWVVASATVSDRHPFSFTQSAAAHGQKLETDVLEAKVRLPMEDPEHPFSGDELLAHEVLGLTGASPFIVIVRLRLLGGRPAVLHRVYLDPARFPAQFLDQHDFKKESLLEVYKQNNYRPVSRDTTLMARGANLYEISQLLQKYHSGLGHRAVLDAEQRLFAQGPDNGPPFVLEFLKATYLENWKYEIKNRPA